MIIVSLVPLYEVEFIPNLTIHENLCLPLVFAALDKGRRGEIVAEALNRYYLAAVANKFYRYLTEEEKAKVSTLRQDIWTRFPDYDAFIKVLHEEKSCDLSLSLLQFEVFTNISRDLDKASARISQEDFREAVEALDEVIERLALRIAFGSFYDIPNLRVIEIALLVIRNYRDILRHRERVDMEIFETEKRRAIPNLKQIAACFIEMRGRG